MTPWYKELMQKCLVFFIALFIDFFWLIAYVNEASKGVLFMFAVVEIFLIIYVIADLQPNYAKPIQNSITNTSLSSKGGKIIDIRELLNLKPNEFSPYRERLIKRGLINGDERGIVRFTLPCFEDYVLNNYLGDE